MGLGNGGLGQARARRRRRPRTSRVVFHQPWRKIARPSRSGEAFGTWRNSETMSFHSFSRLFARKCLLYWFPCKAGRTPASPRRPAACRPPTFRRTFPMIETSTLQTAPRGRLPDHGPGSRAKHHFSFGGYMTDHPGAHGPRQRCGCGTTDEIAPQHRGFPRIPHANMENRHLCPRKGRDHPPGQASANTGRTRAGRTSPG